MAKPRIADAAGWVQVNEDHYNAAKMYVPTELTVAHPEREKRFSYVNADCVLRNWFKVEIEGQRDQYFYGETAWMDAERAARDAEMRAVYHDNDLVW